MPRVLITGVNRGLGLEFLRQYATAGWEVIGTCRDPSGSPEAQAITQAYGGVSLHPLEVTDPAAVNALAVTLGATPIDVLVLNAGVMGDRSRSLGELDAADFARVLQVNVVGAALCLQAFRALVAASERRIIVGIGSILGSVASNADGGLYAYRCSKAALNALLRSASVDLRDEGVTVVSMHPGWVITDMGGPDAHITAAESVDGMRRVIGGLELAASGRFFTYAGDELPW